MSDIVGGVQSEKAGGTMFVALLSPCHAIVVVQGRH